MTMPSIEERLHEAVQREYDQSDHKVPAVDDYDFEYKTDGDGGYWVGVQVYISPMDLHPNPNPSWTVWVCNDYSRRNNWSDFGDWQVDEVFQENSDDDSGTAARRKAHERAKYLRQDKRLLVAVRPAGSKPLPFRSGKSR